MQSPFEKSPKSFSRCLQMAAVFQGVNANTAHLVLRNRRKPVLNFTTRPKREMILDKEAIFF